LSRPNCYVSLSQIARDIPETVLYQNLHLYKNASLTADSWLIANCDPFSLHLFIANAWVQVYLVPSFLAAQPCSPALGSCACLPCWAKDHTGPC